MFAFWRIARSSVLLLAALAVFAADDGFDRWWPSFQDAVDSGEAERALRGAKFPMHWENGPVREVRSEDEMIRRFSTYFTAEIKKAIDDGTPEAYPDGYMLTWHARGNEYSLYFKKTGPNRFALDGLSEGPP